VEGVNIVTRHLKRNPQNPQAGGRQEKPAAIHSSKVMIWSDESKSGVRVRVAGEGRKKRRVSAKSGKPISASGRSKEKRAPK
jgi:large subunit ribosomal protein L24